MPLINDFPLELLGRLFDAFKDAVKSDALETRKAAVTLESVCRLWRDALIHHPRFWSTSTVVISKRLADRRDPYTSRFFDHMERWFGRAGDLPLSLTLRFIVTPSTSPDLFNFFIANRRWKALRFRLGQPSLGHSPWIVSLMQAAVKHARDVESSVGSAWWPMLEEVETDTPITQFRDDAHDSGLNFLVLPPRFVAPNIQRFIMRCPAIQPSLFKITTNINWDTLFHLEIEGVGMDQNLTINRPLIPFLLYVLTHAKNLTFLSLKWDEPFVPVYAPPTNTLPEEVIHHNLSHLAIRVTTSAQLASLGKLCLPSLKSLAMDGPLSNPAPWNMQVDLHERKPTADAIQELLARSRCNIDSLHFGPYHPGSQADLEGIMELLPNVGCLTLTNHKVALHWLQEGKPVVPSGVKRFVYEEPTPAGTTFVTEEGTEDFDFFKRSPLDWYNARMVANQVVKYPVCSDWPVEGLHDYT